MEVWSDSCGLPVELDDTVDYRTPSPPTLLSETVREDLRYSEATLRIKVPLSSEVLVVPSLQAVDQCLSTYAADIEACGGTERCGVDNWG